MNINNAQTGDLLSVPPLPRPEMQAFVERNMHYDAICDKIHQGKFGGNPELLNRIVQLVVDRQYADDELEIAQEILPAEVVAHQVLQLRQYQVEYVLDRLCHHHSKDISDSILLEAVYCAVGSLGAYRYAQSHKLYIN